MNPVKDLTVTPAGDYPDGRRYFIHWRLEDGSEWGDYFDLLPRDADPGPFMAHVLERVVEA